MARPILNPRRGWKCHECHEINAFAGMTLLYKLFSELVSTGLRRKEPSSCLPRSSLCLVRLHHANQPLFVCPGIQATQPGRRLLRCAGRQLLVCLTIRHEHLYLLLPQGCVLLRDHIVTVRVTGTIHHLDRQTVRQVNLGLRETTSIRGNDRDTTKLSFSDDDSPGLMPDRGGDQDLDAIPDLVSVASSVLDPITMLAASYG